MYQASIHPTDSTIKATRSLPTSITKWRRSSLPWMGIEQAGGREGQRERQRREAEENVRVRCVRPDTATGTEAVRAPVASYRIQSEIFKVRRHACGLRNSDSARPNATRSLVHFFVPHLLLPLASSRRTPRILSTNPRILSTNPSAPEYRASDTVSRQTTASPSDIRQTSRRLQILELFVLPLSSYSTARCPILRLRQTSRRRRLQILGRLRVAPPS